MAKLVAQIADIDAEIEVGRRNHEHKVALEAYAAIWNASESELEAIRHAKRQLTVLKTELSIRENAASVEELTEKREAAIACLNDLTAAWFEYDYEVKQSGEFAKFTTVAKNYRISLVKEAQDMFGAWVAETDAQVAVPEPILHLQRKVPDLSKLADKYDVEYDTFRSLSRKLPDEANARRLLAACEAIRAAKAGMILDLPEPVKKFFDALQIGGGASGAPLALLNDDVLQWLDEHGQTENYVIRRKGRASW